MPDFNPNYLLRCFDLARMGAQSAAPNPMVGAVIVHQNRIIGEGFHQKYGGAHAEVNAVQSVVEKNRHLIAESNMYVSLEPCCIHGNTPPCTDLILKHQIPQVIISNSDRTDGVDGKSVPLLRKKKVKVITGILEQKGNSVCKIRNTIVTKNRPYIILKYAQSKDGFIGQKDHQIWLTNSFSKRLVHKWRSEVDVILVGTNTAIIDNPKLTTRHYYGNSPLRIVLDKQLRIPKTNHLFDQSTPTWVYTQVEKPPTSSKNLTYHSISFDENSLTSILAQLYQDKKGIVLVEGGQQVLQSFIDANLWDEARIFTNPSCLNDGIKAPSINGVLEQKNRLLNDTLEVFSNPTPKAI